MAAIATLMRKVDISAMNGSLAHGRPSSEASISAWVELTAVRKTYDGETLVVRDLDLAIGKGEFLTLLGPSGSGKTTTLMMMAGFEIPTSGTIRLAGRELTNLPPHKRGIGVVFQNYALFPHMTLAENVAFPLSVRRLPKAEIASRVERALATVRLSGLGSRRPAQISGGQQQRVALARALVFEPGLILMDEPLGALDRQLRESMQMEIKHLHQKLGVTVVYVTHDQDEALTMSDRVAVFSHGIVQQIGAPADLYQRPLNEFVAGFIGENNLLRGAIAAKTSNGVIVRLSDGSTVHATETTRCEIGGPTILALRPEMVRLDPPSGLGNTLQVVVREVTYRGDHTRIRVATAGGVELLLKLSSASGLRVPTSGDPIAIGWRTEDCRALEQGPTAQASISTGSMS